MRHFQFLIIRGCRAIYKSDTRVIILHTPTELIKIRRTPIWLAFIILPLISSVIGTANYINNIEILKSAWYSLWTQHSLFFCYIFMPPLIGVYASYLWRLEHSGTNWNMVNTLIPPCILVFQKAAVCALDLSVFLTSSAVFIIVFYGLSVCVIKVRK